MPANALESDLAVRASIQVVRAFVRSCHLLTTNADLTQKIEALETRIGTQDAALEERRANEHTAPCVNLLEGFRRW